MVRAFACGKVKAAGRRQDIAGGGFSGEDRSSPISLVNVTVHSHRPYDFFLTLHMANRDGHIVNHAETLAVIGKGVMESAADVESDAIFQRILGSQNRSARRQPEGPHQFRRERNLHLGFFARGKRSGLEFMDIRRRMNQQDVLVGCWMRRKKIRRIGHLRFDQPIMNAPIFFGRKDMLADGQEIVVAVDELEGKHGNPSWNR